MARRARRIGPDHLLRLSDGSEIAALSLEGQLAAMQNFVVTGDVAGGVITAIYERAPTGVPEEYVATGMLISWASRTGGRHEAEEPIALPEGAAAIAIEDGHPDPGPELEGASDLVTAGAEDEPEFHQSEG